MLAIWLIALLVLGGAFFSNFSDNLTAVDGQIPGSESERADELITERFGAALTENDLLVLVNGPCWPSAWDDRRVTSRWSGPYIVAGFER